MIGDKDKKPKTHPSAIDRLKQLAMPQAKSHPPHAGHYGMPQDDSAYILGCSVIDRKWIFTIDRT